MINPFKEFLSVKYVVGLDIHEDFIGAIQIFNSLAGPEIERIAFREVKDLEKIDKELEEFFREENLKGEMVVTCLPTSRAIIRQLALSLGDVKKLGKIIKYQMEPHVPYPIDEMVVDFLPPRPGEEIFAAAVQKRLLSEHLELLSRANLQPDVVSLDDFALSYLYGYGNEDSAEHPVAIIHVTAEKTSVQIINGKGLDFIRVLPEGSGTVEAILETFRIYQIKKPDLKLSRILLTGRGAAFPRLGEQLSLQTRVETALWRPFDKIKHQMETVETDLQSGLSVPLGLALSSLNASSKGFDLRKEEFEISTTMNLKQMFIYMISAILLLAGLFTFDLYHGIFVQQKRHKELNKRITQMLISTFPDTGTIAKGQEAIQMSRKIDEGMAKSLWLENFTSQETVLDVLMMLTKAISEFSDVRINNLSIDGKEIRVNGQSSSFEVVDKLKEKLTVSGYFDETKLVGAKMDKKDKAVKFNFALERKR